MTYVAIAMVRYNFQIQDTHLVSPKHQTVVSLPPSWRPSVSRCKARPEWELQMRMLSIPPVTTIASAACQAIHRMRPLDRESPSRNF